MKTYMFTVEIPEEALAENLPDLISEENFRDGFVNFMVARILRDRLRKSPEGHLIIAGKDTLEIFKDQNAKEIALHGLSVLAMKAHMLKEEHNPATKQ